MLRRPVVVLFAVYSCACGSDRSAQVVTHTVLDPSGCTWQLPVTTGHIAGTDLSELSGIARSRRFPDRFYAHNDSGNPPDVFAIDSTGKVYASFRLDGASNVDWEDVAVGPCGPPMPDAATPSDCVWIGDIGDNLNERKEVHLVRWSEPAELPGAPSAVSIAVGKKEWQELSFHYPDGAQNAEALAVLPDARLLVLTKRNDGTARIYRITPHWPHVGDKPAKVESLGVLGLAVGATKEGGELKLTAADLSSDGSRLIVRTYGSLQLFRGAEVLSGPPGSLADWRALVLPSPVESQGEAVTWDADGTILTASEGKDPAMFRVRCH
ncbi:MAG: hypothetical protein HY902_21235 [Deltaproteobacteria bacterium]|nr:hypothetical protein [Deltaproteobacteria bacterium]